MGRAKRTPEDHPVGAARFRIVIPYLVIGVIWIVFSDQLLLLARGNETLMLALSTAKGWLYILITAVLLDVLVKKEFARRARLEQRLRKENEEKAVLLAEIHHRVKNNMQIVSSIVSLELDKAVTEEARAICTATMARVRSMALVHERLYEERDFGSIDLAGYLRSLVSLIGDIYGGSIEYAWDVEPVEAPPETAIPFGLLVQEALTNALKYGAAADGAHRISLCLHRTAGEAVELRVSDEGSGFPRDKPEKGLGMELMKALAAQMEGTLGFASSPGAVVSLRFTPRLPQSSRAAVKADPGPSAATT
jgi:two-component sensor histidine kinase